MNSESIIVSNIFYNEEFGRKTIPYIKTEYFERKEHQITYDLIKDFVEKYNTWPSKEALLIDLADKPGLNEDAFKNTRNLIIDVKEPETTNIKWLMDKTEEFCKERALHNAILEAIKIIDQNSTTGLSTGSLPKIMSDALAVSFDNRVGHDFIEDADKRYEFYHTTEKRKPFSLDIFNKITEGGLPNKTLSCAMAVTGGGKSRFMCHEAANDLRNGYNVLYITLEMSEEKIAERIDANLLDIPLNELKTIPKEIYSDKMNRMKKKTKGKLIIKEYPTAGAGSAHFRFLLNELKLKKNFTPDMIYIDYINICMSSRLKMGSNVNSYSYVKAIAEELRGLAVEFDVPVMTATQINRGGFSSSDVEMENTSESIALPATLDFFFALISSEELDQMNQILVKQLKNRFSDPSFHKKFCIGIDKPKMRLYDLDNAEEGLVDDKPLMDKTEFGKRDSEFDISKFKGFK